MKKRFTAAANLKTQAKRNHETNANMLKRWFVNKYKLPPNHALFESRSEADLMLEMYDDLHVRRDELREQLMGCDAQAAAGMQVAKLRQAITDQINAINGALGEPNEFYDEQVAKWESIAESGEVPDEFKYHPPQAAQG